jgi:elongation factor 1-beta
MAQSLPAYDLSLDEIHVALSYVTLLSGAPSSAASSVTPAAPAPAPAVSREVAPAPIAAIPAKKVEEAKVNAVISLFFCFMFCHSVTHVSLSWVLSFCPTQPAEEEDDFDVFGDDDDDDDDKPREIANADEVTETGETRREMLARLKKEAEERTAQKEAKQRTLVAIEIKPWDVEQDLMVLWKKITTTIKQDGLKWGEQCTLADVAFGIKKIQCTFVMGVKNSSDEVVEAIEAMEDEVQSVEVTSMNVL